jgi:cytochrome c biogenesis protein
MNVYAGDLGLNGGDPKNVFSLNLHGLKQLTGGKTKVKSLQLEPGQTVDMPNGMGTVTFNGIRRFASLDIDYNPGQLSVLLFALLALAGLITSLLVPRRRVWVKLAAGGFEIAALARGDDPSLERVVDDLVQKIKPEKPEKKVKDV